MNRTRRLSAPLTLVLTLASALLVTAAGPAHADKVGCWQRGCIFDRAVLEADNPARNREVGNDNCNFYSGYWGNSGDDICGDVNGSHWRSNSWCADFVRYVWSQAGANTTGLDPWAGSFYRANATNGSYHPKGSGYTPQVGDAVIYDWDGTPGLGTEGWDIDHVGIVIDYWNGTLNTIEGNTTGSDVRDGVYRKTRPTTQVVGYISPRF